VEAPRWRAHDAADAVTAVRAVADGIDRRDTRPPDS
jgi:hypothetical protein